MFDGSVLSNRRLLILLALACLLFNYSQLWCLTASFQSLSSLWQVLIYSKWPVHWLVSTVHCQCTCLWQQVVLSSVNAKHYLPALNISCYTVYSCCHIACSVLSLVVLRLGSRLSFMCKTWRPGLWTITWYVRRTSAPWQTLQLASVCQLFLRNIAISHKWQSCHARPASLHASIHKHISNLQLISGSLILSSSSLALSSRVCHFVCHVHAFGVLGLPNVWVKVAIRKGCHEVDADLALLDDLFADISSLGMNVFMWGIMSCKHEAKTTWILFLPHMACMILNFPLTVHTLQLCCHCSMIDAKDGITIHGFWVQWTNRKRYLEAYLQRTTSVWRHVFDVVHSTSHKGSRQ